MADLDEAILKAREAVKVTSPDHPNRAARLKNLGVYLGSRYFRIGAIEDLEEAIRVTREAVEATPPDSPDRAGRLSNLGVYLGNKYLRTEEIEDLDGAIYIGREVVKLTPPGHPDRPGSLSNLGVYLGDRYSCTGLTEDLDEATRIIREAVEATPPDHPDRVKYLSNLGARLGHRYLCTGAMDDLEEAIRMVRGAIKTAPPDYPDRHIMLNNLGAYLGDKYSHTGSIKDLDESIRLVREAIKITQPDYPDRARWLSNLGIYLGDRYSHAGAMKDLEEAILIAREAVRTIPPDHTNRAVILSTLAKRLGDRYLRTRAIGDLEEAIYIGRKAVDATPSDHPDQARQLNNLGADLQARYLHTGAIEDLEEAIRIVQDAINATPLGHPNQSGQLNNLGACLGNRYSRTGAMEDLDEAIRIGREAIDATPSDHLDQAYLLDNLGIRLGDRYSRMGGMTDLDESKKCFIDALHLPNSIIGTRIAAGRHFLSSPAILDDQRAFSIAKTTIDLIPFLTPHSLQNTDRHHLLSAVVGLSSDAAAIALHTNEGPTTALELLETGRGVIAAALFERSDISALQRDHPELEQSFVELRDQLDAPAPRASVVDADGPGADAAAEGDRRRRTEDQLSCILKTIRSMPNFERFLRSASEADMLDASRHGPIVVLNVSSHRCDALIIVRSGIRLLELRHLSQTAINDRLCDLRSLETLGWLWDVIVRPVLDSLGFTGPPQDGQWPRLWWVPTGALARFPLHAAGHHLRRSGEAALDRCVSSYGSSVKAIIRSYQRRSLTPAEGGDRHAVLVAMQNTAEQEPLLFASAEIDAVRAACESMKLPHVQPRPCNNDVASALETCSIFHFAGHGGAHPTEPLRSQLLLEDWQSEPFTVTSLLDANLSTKSPFLAYLSACGTSQILDDGSVDESIHLTNACQLAGFRHVIGTLWSVDDELSVDMAKMTYEFLREEGMGDLAVSRGLHRATRTLRDRWVGSGEPKQPRVERDAGLIASGPRRPHWVPYVHFGV